MNRNSLPPIIEQYIEKLESNDGQFQKDTAALVLEQIRDACDAAIRKYNSRKSHR